MSTKSYNLQQAQNLESAILPNYLPDEYGRAVRIILELSKITNTTPSELIDQKLQLEEAIRILEQKRVTAQKSQQATLVNMLELADEALKNVNKPLRKIQEELDYQQAQIAIESLIQRVKKLIIMSGFIYGIWSGIKEFTEDDNESNLLQSHISSLPEASDLSDTSSPERDLDNLDTTNTKLSNESIIDQKIQEYKSTMRSNYEQDPNFIKNFSFNEFFRTVDGFTDNATLEAQHEKKQDYERIKNGLKRYTKKTYRILHEIAQLRGRYSPNASSINNLLTNYKNPDTKGDCQAALKLQLSLLQDLRPDIEVRIQVFRPDPSKPDSVGHETLAVKVEDQWYNLENLELTPINFEEEGNLFYKKEDMILAFLGFQAAPSEIFSSETPEFAEELQIATGVSVPVFTTTKIASGDTSEELVQPKRKTFIHPKHRTKKESGIKLEPFEK